MKVITVHPPEQWDESKEEFVYGAPFNLYLEHSLVSISKWESTWKKPFLSDAPRSNLEALDYIRCMTLNKNVDPKWYTYLSQENLEEIRKYIDDPMTATTVAIRKEKGGYKPVVTSEVIYHWMLMYSIPFETQHWHLNRLITLIKVCQAKNHPSKKMSEREQLDRNRKLNAERLKRLHTRG